MRTFLSISVLLLVSLVSQAQFVVPGTVQANAFRGDGSGLTNLPSHYSSLNIDTLTVTNQFPTNSFMGPTNTLNLNNNYQLYTASGNVGISGVGNLLASGSKWATLFITNASGSTVTGYVSVGRALGAGTTNILSIPSGKIGVVSFTAYGTMFTNYCTAVQQ